MTSVPPGEDLFRAITENMTETAVVVSAEGEIRYASPSIEGLSGYAAESVVGRSAFSLIHPDDVEASRTALRELADEHELPGPVAFRALRADGSTSWIEASGRNLLANPAVRGIVVTLRDVTERRQLEMQLLGAQKMEAVGRLAGGIAHDFNNILTVIRGHAAMLIEDSAPEDPIRSDLEEIHAAAERATVLTSRLLAFSRRQTFQLSEMTLAGVLQGMAAMLRRMLPSGIELAIEVEDEGRVQADLGQLEQVVMNLGVNARDAMQAGGRLTLGVGRVELSDQDARAFPFQVRPGAYALLSARDTGHGMDEATRARIFEPFFTTKEAGMGTGLGLAMVYGVVKQSRGFILVESDVGRGAAFLIYLPEHAGAGGTGADRDAGTAATGDGETPQGADPAAPP